MSEDQHHTGHQLLTSEPQLPAPVTRHLLKMALIASVSLVTGMRAGEVKLNVGVWT